MIDSQARWYVAFLRGPHASRLFSVSEDFVHWSAPAESMPAVPSKTGAPPIRVGDRLYIYYRGSSETHDRSGNKPEDSYDAGANGLAVLRADGFASVAAGFDGGRLVTKPILFEGQKLSINAKADFYGSVLVEALDAGGRPIPGYTVEDAIPMTEDRVDASVAWKKRADLGALAGRPIELRFHLTNARLYAYRIR